MLWKTIGALTIVPLLYTGTLLFRQDLFDNYELFMVVGVISLGLSIVLAVQAVRKRLGFWPLWIVGLFFAGILVCPIAWWVLNKNDKW